MVENLIYLGRTTFPGHTIGRAISFPRYVRKREGALACQVCYPFDPGFPVPSNKRITRNAVGLTKAIVESDSKVINHGISPLVMEGALDSASNFFNLPIHEKMQLVSDDVTEPVRYGTSLNYVREEIHCWRDFLKHYSHPLSKWIHSWPSNPPQYKEKMGAYAEAVQNLAIELMEAIFESLGLKPTYLKEEMEESMQVMAVNCYPACPEPELTLGMLPHSDYGCLTILLQNCQGLEVKDKEEKWMPVPAIDGALLVHVGDHLEVTSNGRYKSVIHRAVVNSEKRRLSIASLHSLAIYKKVGPALELVDKQHPMAYTESSFGDFLKFLSANDVMKGRRYIETLKMEQNKDNGRC